MEKINKKISVILPAYNAEKTLDRCFRSLDKQKYKPDEIVVVDDASEDNTKKIIYLWKESLPLKYFKNNNNMGLPLSLNRAIKESKGELLIRIDSDDEWKSNHIEEIINLYKKNDAVLFSTRSQYISEDSKPISSTKILSNDSVRKLLMWDNPFVHSAIAFKKSDYVLTSGYPLDNYAQDYSLFIELLNKGELVASDKITVNYFVNSGSLSRQNLNASKHARFKYQFLAIKKFWNIHPFEAIKIIPILIIRMILLRLFYK